MQFGYVVLGVEDELMSAVSSMNQGVDWRSADDLDTVVSFIYRRMKMCTWRMQLVMCHLITRCCTTTSITMPPASLYGRARACLSSSYSAAICITDAVDDARVQSRLYRDS